MNSPKYILIDKSGLLDHIKWRFKDKLQKLSQFVDIGSHWEEVSEVETRATQRRIKVKLEKFTELKPPHAPTNTHFQHT